MEYQEAFNIAKEYYWNRGQQVIVKIYEAEQFWIFYGGVHGQEKYGGHAITVNKTNGEIGKFILPSRENFQILRTAKLIENDEK